jgi:hypothetical protein
LRSAKLCLIGVSLVNFFVLGGVQPNEFEPERPCRILQTVLPKTRCGGSSPRRACAASGHAAAPPSKVMNSRRFN